MSDQMDGGADSAPLLGFLVEESDTEVRVQVPSGVWIIERSDMESMSDWDDAPAGVDVDGRPVQVITKPDATLGFLQTFKLDPSDRPMTLAQKGSVLFGAQHLEELAVAWGGQNGLDQTLQDVGSSPTVCNYDDPSGFGMVVITDDCKD